MTLNSYVNDTVIAASGGVIADITNPTTSPVIPIIVTILSPLVKEAVLTLIFKLKEIRKAKKLKKSQKESDYNLVD